MYDIEGKLMTENAESNTEEQELKCPKCGKKIIEDGPAFCQGASGGLSVILVTKNLDKTML